MSGCSGEEAKAVEPVSEIETAVPVFSGSYEEGFTLFREQDCNLSLYEPESGCLIGAYIQSSIPVNQDLKLFEASVGKEHSFYTYFMKMGQPFPADWVLNCISENKTPNIVITPENIDDPFNTSFLERTAKKISEFYVPVFVHIYPIKAEYGYDTREYINFYKVAAAVFKRYASNAALVWDIDLKDATLAEEYYPGDDYIDWVGLNVYQNIEDKNTNLPDNADFNHFYYMFQERKPIFISQLGISHFTKNTYSYHVKESGERFKDFYDSVKNDYPRVKAVNYMDYNGISPVNMPEGENNYSVTDHEDMTEYYSKAVSGEYFLSEVDFSLRGERVKQLIREPYKVNYYDGDYYLPEYASDTLGIYESDESAVEFDTGIFHRLKEEGEGYRLETNFNKRAVVLRLDKARE
jgi:hypothetical protein